MKNKVYFENLDGLRFIAFFLVFVQHCFALDLNISNNYIHALREGALSAGDVGVSFFFVLSGFLITYLILSEINLTGQINIKNFYIRRTLRIWPLYFGVLVLGFVIYPALKSLMGNYPAPANNPWYYFTFASNFDLINVMRNFYGQDFIALDVTWSVAIEEQFYLVWPLFFLILPKRNYHYIFWSVIIFSLLFRIYYYDDYLINYLHTFSVISDMAVGGLFAYYAINNHNFIPFFEKLKKPLIITIYVLGILLVLHRNLISEVIPPITRVLCSLFYAFIILEQNYCSKSVYKISGSKLLTNLGKISYGLYLLHPWSIQAIIVVKKFFNWNTSNYLIVILINATALILTIIISYISFNYFEAYFLNMKKKFALIKKAA